MTSYIYNIIQYVIQTNFDSLWVLTSFWEIREPQNIVTYCGDHNNARQAVCKINIMFLCMKNAHWFFFTFDFFAYGKMRIGNQTENSNMTFCSGLSLGLTIGNESTLCFYAWKMRIHFVYGWFFSHTEKCALIIRRNIWIWRFVAGCLFNCFVYVI